MAIKLLPMTDGEILAEFRQAKNKREQIKILADQCMVAPRVIANKLQELGALEGTGIKIGRYSGRYTPVNGDHGTSRDVIDEIRAMELFNEGLDDLAMAETLGVSRKRVEEWRSRMHLQRKVGRPKKKTEEETDVKKFKERETEETVIEADERREQVFEEILESVDAGKKQEPEVVEDTNVPDKSVGNMPTLTCPADCKGAPQSLPEMTAGGFIQLLTSLTNARTLNAPLVINGRYVNGIHRLIVDGSGDTLTVEVETR